MSAPSYLAPASLDEALAALAGTELLVLAGATDVYPASVGRPIDRPVLDLARLPGFDRVLDEGTQWRLPALVTWAEIADADLPPLFDGLRAAARTVGGVQIQNVATLCGNLCNASPAADGVPNLIALDAVVELASARGTRRLPVAEFVLGNRRTARAADELVTAVLVPKPAHPARSAFRKLGSRSSLVISIVMVAGVVELDGDASGNDGAGNDGAAGDRAAGGMVRAARFAAGACSPVARRLPALEGVLVGQSLQSLTPQAIRALVGPECVAGLEPIDDVRGTAGYRLDAAVTLLRRLVADLAAPAGAPGVTPRGTAGGSAP